MPEKNTIKTYGYNIRCLAGRHIMPFPGQELPVRKCLKVLMYSGARRAGAVAARAGPVRQENRFMIEPAGVLGLKFTLWDR